MDFAKGKNTAEGKPLKIALVAPLVAPIGPPFLGGAQVMIHDLARGLAQRGHEVTLFAAKNSCLDGKAGEETGRNLQMVQLAVEPGELSPADFGANGQASKIAADPSFFRQGELFLQIYLEINRKGNRFQLAHAHAFDWPAFALSPLSRVPVVHTVHLPSVDPRINAILNTTYRQTGSSSAVTVSRACAATYAGDFPFDRVIYNGIDAAPIPFGPRGQGYLLFAGRMAPEKGPDLAIAIARRAGRRLVLAGGVYDRKYYEEKIAPELTKGDLEYRGRLGREELCGLMSGADGVLFPSRWEEPFGLVLAEALAAGAPVISWRRGAAPEIVEDGRQGFLVAYLDIEGAAGAVKKLKNIDRAECRNRIKVHFSLEKMLDRYEEYYFEVIARCRER